jgi:hypothetical protein
MKVLQAARQVSRAFAVKTNAMRSRKDNWFVQNRYAKRFINICVMCGKQGYAPQIDHEGFAGNESTVYHQFSRGKLKNMLRAYFEPLAVDEAGRCQMDSGPDQSKGHGRGAT